MARSLTRGFGGSGQGFPSTVNYSSLRQSKMPTTNLNSQGFHTTTTYGDNSKYRSQPLKDRVVDNGGGSTRRSGGSLSAAAQYLQPGNNIYDLKNKMAQDAYNRGMAALNAAYGEYMAALSDNLGSTKGALLDAYNRSKKSIMDDSRSSLKQAYINKVLSEKNLAQQMSAQGLSGGATETTRASMSNNYGNARNNINTTTNNNLSSLEGEYNQNLADAMQAYNMAVANAQLQKAQQVMALEDALANNQIAALDDFNGLMAGDQEQYMAALQAAIDKNGQFEFTPSEAINKVNAPEITQRNNAADRDYSNLLAALQDIIAQTGKDIPFSAYRGTPYTPPYTTNMNRYYTPPYRS